MGYELTPSNPDFVSIADFCRFITKEGLIMNTYKILPNLLQEEGKSQKTFCAIISHGKKSAKLEGLKKSDRGQGIPLVLMMMRWDGLIGFPGGSVEDGESLTKAVAREIKEEVNWDIDISKLNPLCSLSLEDRNIHCFYYVVENDTMKRIIRSATNGPNFLKENQGCFAVQIANFENGTGIKQFRKSNFKGTAGIEFDILLKQMLPDVDLLKE